MRRVFKESRFRDFGNSYISCFMFLELCKWLSPLTISYLDSRAHAMVELDCSTSYIPVSLVVQDTIIFSFMRGSGQGLVHVTKSLSLMSPLQASSSVLCHMCVTKPNLFLSFPPSDFHYFIFAPFVPSVCRNSPITLCTSFEGLHSGSRPQGLVLMVFQARVSSV